MKNRKWRLWRLETFPLRRRWTERSFVDGDVGETDSGSAALVNLYDVNLKITWCLTSATFSFALKRDQKMLVWIFIQCLSKGPYGNDFTLTLFILLTLIWSVYPGGCSHVTGSGNSCDAGGHWRCVQVMWLSYTSNQQQRSVFTLKFCLWNKFIIIWNYWQHSYIEILRGRSVLFFL